MTWPILDLQSHVKLDMSLLPQSVCWVTVRLHAMKLTSGTGTKYTLYLTMKPCAQNNFIKKYLATEHPLYQPSFDYLFTIFVSCKYREQICVLHLEYILPLSLKLNGIYGQKVKKIRKSSSDNHMTGCHTQACPQHTGMTSYLQYSVMYFWIVNVRI